MAIENEIISALKNRETWVFCISDMLSFGNYKAVAKAIERLTKDGTIKRLFYGVYYYPLLNHLLKREYPPQLEDIANALARNNNWEILETSSTALYKLGLDNQIPIKFIYLSSGPYKKYTVDNRTIEFKNASSSNFKFINNSGLVIQVLKALGDSNINDGILLKMSDKLNMHEKENLLENLMFAPVWMHKYLKVIGDLNNEKRH